MKNTVFKKPSNLTPAQIADRLKVEADLLLKEIEPILGQFGSIVYGGSYALDLMAWPDIDMHLLPHPQKNIYELVPLFYQNPNMISVKIERDLHKRVPGLPEGEYFQIKLNHKSLWKLPWKLDIWILTPEQSAESMAFTEKVREALTRETRKAILEKKQSKITEKGRTQQFSGPAIYREVLSIE